VAVAAVFEDPAAVRLHLLESSQVVVAFSPGAPRMSSPDELPSGSGGELPAGRREGGTTLIFFKVFDKIFVPTFFSSSFF
jgi:hypothetical protein